MVQVYETAMQNGVTEGTLPCCLPEGTVKNTSSWGAQNPHMSIHTLVTNPQMLQEGQGLAQSTDMSDHVSGDVGRDVP